MNSDQDLQSKKRLQAIGDAARRGEAGTRRTDYSSPMTQPADDHAKAGVAFRRAGPASQGDEPLPVERSPKQENL